MAVNPSLLYSGDPHVQSPRISVTAAKCFLPHEIMALAGMSVYVIGLPEAV